MKYNEFKINWGGETFIFVSRKAEQAISQKEAIEYLRDRSMNKTELSSAKLLREDEEEEKTFAIKDTRMNRHIFMQDLRRGLDFCVRKYGVDEDQLIAEAQRLSPHFAATLLRKEKEDAEKSNT